MPTQHRLRLYLVAAHDLPQNTQITADAVKLHWGWLANDNHRFFSSKSRVVGRYSQKHITNGDLLDPDAVASVPMLIPPPGGAVMPVSVKAGHVKGIIPGSHIAFAKDKSLIPTLQDLLGR